MYRRSESHAKSCHDSIRSIASIVLAVYLLLAAILMAVWLHCNRWMASFMLRFHLRLINNRWTRWTQVTVIPFQLVKCIQAGWLLALFEVTIKNATFQYSLNQAQPRNWRSKRRRNPSLHFKWADSLVLRPDEEEEAHVNAAWNWFRRIACRD